MYTTQGQKGVAMRKQHLIVVDDIPELLAPLERWLHRTYGEKYAVYGFSNAVDALGHLDKIDQKGDILALVATDEKMPGMQGHELLRTVGETHPICRRVLYSGYTDYNALREACNNGVHRFVQKANPNEGAEGIFTVIRKQLEEYERQPKIELVLDKVGLEPMVEAGIISPEDALIFADKELIIKLVDTEYENRGFYACRYNVYTKQGNITDDYLDPEQVRLKQEWDKYDNDPNTISIVAKMGGDVIGGARKLKYKIPMEDCQIVKVDENGNIIERTGKKCLLENYRSQYGLSETDTLYKVEISRLCVDPGYRRLFDEEVGESSAVVMMGIFRIIAQLTRDHDLVWGTARKSRGGMYKALGFEFIKDEDGEPIDLEYDESITGTVVPLVYSWSKATKALSLGEKQNLIEGFNGDFYQKAIKPIDRVDPIEWIKASQELYKIAPEFFTAVYVSNGK